MSESKWISKAKAKDLPDTFIDGLSTSGMSDVDKERVVDEIEVEPGLLSAPAAIPDLPNGILVELRPDELPVIGRHFVVWGSEFLNDIRERPVRRTSQEVENVYAWRIRDEAQQLVDMGLKDPDPRLPDRYPRHRCDRAEKYARWRYRGFVAGEIAGL